MKFSHKTILTILAVILLMAAGWKAFLLRMEAIPFNADEAIVALMARHILSGERPLFFYGQAYMGSLDAFLVAAGFLVFGQQVWVIRLVQALLYLGTIITTIFIGKDALGSLKTGLLAGALLAIPTVNVTLYTTASLGGYGEALLIGNLVLLTGYRLLRSLRREEQTEGLRWKWSHPGVWLGWGFLVGLGLWANGLTLIYSIPVAAALGVALFRRRGRVGAGSLAPVMGVALLGFLAGSAPWWLYAAQNGAGALLSELAGSAVAVEPGSWLQRSFRHLLSLIVLGGTATIGARPPWEVRWLALPLLPLALAFWLAVGYFFARLSVRPGPQREAYRMLMGVALTLLAGFVLTSFGTDPSGRYFVPLAVPLALAAGEMVQAIHRKPLVQLSLVGVVVVFNLWGTLQCALQNPPGLTTQFDLQTALDHRHDRQLMQFLEQEGELYGYSSYWVSYPLAFLSEERMIYLPHLPYHADLRYTSRDDRYEPYRDRVENAGKVAYITARSPLLDERLREGFRTEGVSWLEKTIGDFRVFYRLSQPVRPDVMGWGQANGN